jgi:hypothetical protein
MLETAKPDLDLIQETLQPINKQLIHDSPLPQAAAAAKFARPSPSELTQQLEMLEVTLNIFEPAVTETLPLQGTHNTLGLITEQHPKYLESLVFQQCHPGTVSHKTIRRWKSRLKGAIIQMVDNILITDREQFQQVLQDKRRKGQTQA